jgi:hypothetical protein
MHECAQESAAVGNIVGREHKQAVGRKHKI